MANSSSVVGPSLADIARQLADRNGISLADAQAVVWVQAQRQDDPSTGTQARGLDLGVESGSAEIRRLANEAVLERASELVARLRADTRQAPAGYGMPMAEAATPDKRSPTDENIKISIAALAKAIQEQSKQWGRQMTLEEAQRLAFACASINQN